MGFVVTSPGRDPGRLAALATPVLKGEGWDDLVLPPRRFAVSPPFAWVGVVFAALAWTALVRLPLQGGRAGGFRTWSSSSLAGSRSGKVSVETLLESGQIVGRMTISVQ